MGTGTKRNHVSLSGEAKVDTIYCSLDSLEAVESLEHDTPAAHIHMQMQTASGQRGLCKLRQLTFDSLSLVVKLTNQERALIASACVNTPVEKVVHLAHKKVTKEECRVKSIAD